MQIPRYIINKAFHCSGLLLYPEHKVAMPRLSAMCLLVTCHVSLAILAYAVQQASENATLINKAMNELTRASQQQVCDQDEGIEDIEQEDFDVNVQTFQQQAPPLLQGLVVRNSCNKDTEGLLRIMP